MNYILHLNKTFEKICEDDRLTPFHVSLYFSLFQYWNMARFRNPISISRDELMRSSKIGSVNTYIRCIKELDKWQYIQYVPSYNPQKGSQVYLYNFNTVKQHQNNNTITTFDNSNNNGTNISDNKSNDKTPEKATGKASEKPVIPSINNTNKLNNKNTVNGKAPTNKNLIFKDLSSNAKPKDKKEKSSGKKEKVTKLPSLFGEGRGDEAKGRLPTPKIIATYFAQKQWPAIESEKFFNHYESNGWLIGGKSPMKNWQAAARNWMLNAEKFNHGKTITLKSTHVKTGKDYSEPL